MKLHTRTNGTATLLDLLIVVLVGVLAYLLYTRGRLDQYLPEEYRYATRLAAAAEASKATAEAPKATADAPNADAVTPGAATPPAPAPAVASVPAPAPTPAPASQAAPPAPAATVTQILAPLTLPQMKALPRRQWPSHIAIRREMDMPVFANGQQIGSMKAKPGTMFELMDIRDDGVVIRAGEQPRLLPVADTDLQVRFQQTSSAR